MQIKKIHISNFGKLHEMQMDFSEGLNVINGENGWGKSTLAAFLKAMLYGMDVTTKRSLLENERRRYKPMLPSLLRFIECSISWMNLRAQSWFESNSIITCHSHRKHIHINIINVFMTYVNR